MPLPIRNKLSITSYPFLVRFCLPFLLSGKVGRWKNYFTVAQSDAFDMIYKEKLQGTGLDFDFEL